MPSLFICRVLLLGTTGSTHRCLRTEGVRTVPIFPDAEDPTPKQSGRLVSLLVSLCGFLCGFLSDFFWQVFGLLFDLLQFAFVCCFQFGFLVSLESLVFAVCIRLPWVLVGSKSTYSRLAFHKFVYSGLRFPLPGPAACCSFLSGFRVRLNQQVCPPTALLFFLLVLSRE